MKTLMMVLVFAGSMAAFGCGGSDEPAAGGDSAGGEVGTDAEGGGDAGEAGGTVPEGTEGGDGAAGGEAGADANPCAGNPCEGGDMGNE